MCKRGGGSGRYVWAVGGGARGGYYMVAAVLLQLFTVRMRTKVLEAKHAKVYFLHRVGLKGGRRWRVIIYLLMHGRSLQSGHRPS